MDDIFDENGVRTYFVTERLIDPTNGVEYVHIKAKKDGLPFVTRRRVSVTVAEDLETLAIIGTDMHNMLGRAVEASENDTLAPLCEIEED